MIEKTCWRPMTKLGYANFTNQMLLTDILTITNEELWPYISLFTNKRVFAQDFFVLKSTKMPFKLKNKIIE